ncbi:histidinol-phosphate transaminase [Parvularcula sp. ZS-1/3]|uniref:Histidinol-phosphate aminotransferase n=1 Tax=Parvularcula mediterranea TaxID=2732508 RepID=A0A7Y3RL05_9PROT|nr:histidinol-phosphate transaminase [Parvularcula mediterranea]NNU16018.1 histidinol-phosphate transaminase [Parvularcula mediterranea]
MTTRPTPRSGLLDISPYVPGKSKAEGKTYKLSSNESALGPAPSAIEAAREVAGALHLYPDGSATGLREALAKLHSIDAERIIVGNGSDEVLTLSVKCFTEPGDEVLMTRHGFSYYPILTKAEGCKPVMAEEDDLTADVDELLAAVSERTKVVLLANPNNPTGTLLPSDEVRRLREELPPHVLLVIDGAYAEYVEADDYDGGLALVEEAEASGAANVVMTRTFSKIYGLGGMRVGWGYVPSALIDVMNRVRGPFNVNAPALAGAEAALADQGFVEENRRHNFEDMARLTQRLRGRGFEVRETLANFILIDLGTEDRARAFLKHQEEAGVFIRSTASSNLPTFVRVSIGAREANDAFLAAAESFDA